MRFSIQGIGAWGPGFQSWQDLAALLRGEQVEVDAATPLKPAVIPANERRRAPQSAKLAVEVCSQATDGLSDAERNMACVFVSGLGDTDLTEYMCRQLAGDEKQLSPTKFHNSVHNAPAGYWTIATGCTQPASALAGLYRSVSEGLLEALVQCQTEGGPVLLAVYDTPATSTLSRLYPCTQPFAAAFVLSAGESPLAQASVTWQVEAAEACAWPEVPLPSSIQLAYQTNIAARVLALLAPLALGGREELRLPLSAGTCLRLSVEPNRNTLLNKGEGDVGGS